ncbi:MAG: glycosyltransferase family 2 protein [Candidatus Lindowbacteria bacterium]|nr:glycosyltransferase family 2 protein [Candidatus Lindowbacteria bacterium]
MKASECLIIIPAHNERDSIASVIRKTKESAPGCHIVVVDDYSTDDTAHIVSDLGVPTIKLPCNLGYARAIQTGMKYALRKGFEAVVLLDADGQHNPGDIAALLSTLEKEKADVVIGSRFAGGRKPSGPLGRRAGMRIFSWLTFLTTGVRIYDTTSGFKAVNRRAYEKLAFEQIVDFHAEALVSLSFAGMKIVEYPVVMAERASGLSMYGWMSHFKYPLKTILLVFIAVFRAYFERGRDR